MGKGFHPLTQKIQLTADDFHPLANGKPAIISWNRR